jgi:hypothetical protein
LKVHKEKLEALPDERRKGVEEGLRRKFEEHEKNFWALDGHANYFEELDSLFEKQKRGTARHVDRAHQASGKVKGQQKEPENDRDREIEANYKNMIGDDEVVQKAFGGIRDAGIKAKVEADLRQRLGQWHDQKKEAGGAAKDFTLGGKHRPLAEQLSIDIDRIIDRGVKADERLDGKPEREEHAKKLRDDLKAKTPHGPQQDHDRER